MIKQSGKLANTNGDNLEKMVQEILITKEYELVEKNKFLLATNGLEQKLYTKQMIVCESIYSTLENKHELSADFVFYNHVCSEGPIIIECKSQTSSGSVDEKYPYLNENIRLKYPYKTIVVLEAPAAKKGAKEWLKNQEKSNSQLMHVFELSEFRTWAIKKL